MRSLVKLSLIAAAIPLVGAMPALAQKAGGQKPLKAEAAGEVPPRLLVALERAFPQVGHGADVPRGKGHGWGHLLHDHQETPVSP
ncbi:hypothetical protein [Allosphingosinicella humi]